MEQQDAISFAVGKIRSEHRSLSAVLRGMQHLMRQSSERGEGPDFPLLRAMVFYVDAFPEQLHHPKEDHFLFRLLRQRTAEEAAVLNVLEHQHSQGEGRIRELEQVLLRYETGGPGYAFEFAELVEGYAQFYWRHMSLEENIVLPLAERVLSPEDWREIAAAFGKNDDPLFGATPEQEFQELFRHITTLHPPPVFMDEGWPQRP